MPTDQTVRFDDGRLLGYDDVGSSHGPPVFFFHGTPGARTYWSLAGDPADAVGTRIISIDRPGFGLSTPEPQRSIGSFAFDVSRLADALGIERFSVLGFSGGAPYALATASHLPDRVCAVALIAPIADLSVPDIAASLDDRLKRGMTFATSSPTGHASAVAELLGPDRLVTTITDHVWAHLPPVDRAILNRPEVKAAAHRMLKETARQGIEGARLEIDLMTRPWDFSVEEIAAPVLVFSGEQDVWSTSEMSRWLESEVPHAEVRSMPSEGHFGVLVNHSDRVLEQLLEIAGALR